MARSTLSLRRSLCLLLLNHPSLPSFLPARRAASTARRPAAMAYTASTPAPPPLPVPPTHAAGLAAAHGEHTPALYAPSSSPTTTLTFGALAAAAARVAGAIRAALPEGDSAPGDPSLPPAGPRVAILARPGPAYAAGLWGAWAAGCVAVPLHAPYPPPALAHPVLDGGCVALLVGGGCAWPAAGAAVLEEVGKGGGAGGRPPALVDLDAALAGGGGESAPHAAPLPPPAPPAHGALLLYTSGTTGPPKGALHTGSGLGAQAASLAAAWALAPGDAVLNALPLHHVHGLVNALVAPLAAGAAVELAPAFSPTAVWGALTRGLVEGEAGGGAAGGPAVPGHPSPPSPPPPPTVLMAVPTMYAYLLDAYDALPPARQAPARAGAARLRLAVCGSAACPAPTAARWAALAGGVPLLERYGMTEAGMVLGQAYGAGAPPRVRGAVGRPMPGVGVGVVPIAALPAEAGASSWATPTPTAAATGELLVRWPGLFAGYWRRPDATAAAFTPGGWFRTGDVVAVEEEAAGGGGRGGGAAAAAAASHNTAPLFTILGRASTDILKVGGFKVSALQVEDALLSHPGVAEAAVVGVPGGARGDAVAAAVVVRAGSSEASVSREALSAWVAGRLPPAAVPRAEHVVFMTALPRNALGKVDKPRLRRGAFGQ